jgi:hypothetical protein
MLQDKNNLGIITAGPYFFDPTIMISAGLYFLRYLTISLMIFNFKAQNLPIFFNIYFQKQKAVFHRMTRAEEDVTGVHSIITFRKVILFSNEHTLDFEEIFFYLYIVPMCLYTFNEGMMIGKVYSFTFIKGIFFIIFEIDHF